MSADRIKAARELLGLSQGELAGAAGLSQGFISQVERGQKVATEETLRAVAKSTGLPWKFFTKESRPSAEDSLRFRKYQTASAKDTARARRTFTELADAASDLMEWAQQPTPSLPAGPYEELDGARIEVLAEETRLALGVDEDAPIRHLTRALERTSVPVAPIVFADLSGEERDEVAAVGHYGLSSLTGENGRPTIGYFPSSGDRQRFTLAHELGHLVMHCVTMPGVDQEKESDRFAGALLMPESAARRVLNQAMTLRDFAVVKAEWGISIQALVMRAFHLELIGSERRVSLYKQISARGWRRSEPVVVKNEAPALLGMLIARRYGERGNVYLRAAEDIGLPPVHLRSTMPPPPIFGGSAQVQGRVVQFRRDRSPESDEP